MTPVAVLRILLLTGGLSAAASPAVVAAQCPTPSGGRVSIRVGTGTARTEYRYDLSTAEIGRLGRKEEALGYGKGTMLGLTRSGFDLRLSTTHHVARVGDRVCLWITAIDAKLTIPSMTVYVSSNYRVGSCEHRAILEHENSHVQRTTALLRPYAAKLEDELRAAAKKPLVGRDPGKAEKEMMAALQNRVAGVMASLEKERARVNDQLDTEDNYRKTAARCRNW